MSSTMIDETRLEELGAELAKGIKTEKDLADPLGQFMKMTIQKALDTEMENHLGYEKYSPPERNKKNSRNGYSSKTIKGDYRELEIEVPRDRESEFEPQIVKKG